MLLLDPFFKGTPAVVAGTITAGGAMMLGLGIYFLVHDARGMSLEKEHRAAVVNLQRLSGTFVF